MRPLDQLEFPEGESNTALTIGVLSLMTVGVQLYSQFHGCISPILHFFEHLKWYTPLCLFGALVMLIAGKEE